jgi:hypothetical protein
MSNRTPASPYSQSSDLSKEIISRVSAHADRSLDRIFADIDNLLDGDGSNPPQQPATGYNSSVREAKTRPNRFPSSTNQPPNYPTEPVLPESPLSSESQEQDRYSPADYSQGRGRFDSTNTTRTDYSHSQPSNFQPTTPPEQTQHSASSVSSPRKKFLPVWSKVFLGIGITSVALSSVLLWLINERKIDLPKNIDLSWLPFQSKSSISPEDAKFADYMRKSITKIDAANRSDANNTTTPSNPKTESTTSSSTPLTNSSIGVITSTTPATIPVNLLKILSGEKRPGAEFEIQGKVIKVYVGDKIGNSNWSLVTVAKGEVIVKKISGEIRSIYVGQKF